MSSNIITIERVSNGYVLKYSDYLDTITVIYPNFDEVIVYLLDVFKEKTELFKREE